MQRRPRVKPFCSELVTLMSSPSDQRRLALENSRARADERRGFAEHRPLVLRAVVAIERGAQALHVGNTREQLAERRPCAQRSWLRSSLVRGARSRSILVSPPLSIDKPCRHPQGARRVVREARCEQCNRTPHVLAGSTRPNRGAASRAFGALRSARIPQARGAAARPLLSEILARSASAFLRGPRPERHTRERLLLALTTGRHILALWGASGSRRTTVANAGRYKQSASGAMRGFVRVRRAAPRRAPRISARLAGWNSSVRLAPLCQCSLRGSSRMLSERQISSCAAQHRGRAWLGVLGSAPEGFLGARRSNGSGLGMGWLHG